MYKPNTLPSSPRYPAGGRSSKQRSLNPLWLKAGAGVVAALLAVLVIILIQKPEPLGRGAVLVITNVDADIAGTGLDVAAPEIAAAAADVASQGGGTLTVIAAAGGAAQTVSTADLRVEREGELETDAQVRDRVAAERVADALAAAHDVRLTDSGRNLLSLLAAAAEHAPPQGEPFSIFYVGFGLATVDPADARIAMAGEPAQAVDGIASRLPALPGAQMHAVFPAAAGPQPEPNTVTATWRKEYWLRLARAMKATLVDVTSATQPAEAAADAPSAPVIPNLPDPTPVPPGKPGNPPPPDSAPVVFGGGNFLPDSDKFTEPDAAVQALAPLAAAWAAHPGAYSSAECIGRTAAIGPAASARQLSQRRSARAAALLEDTGVASVTATGLGFDDPLPDYPPADPHQRSVVCRLIPQP